jgi:hypothetical protein
MTHDAVRAAVHNPAARAEWKAANGNPDPAQLRELSEQYRNEVLPRLSNVSLSRIMTATGWSVRYSSLVRRGEKIPHPMHFGALERVSVNP